MKISKKQIFHRDSAMILPCHPGVCGSHTQLELLQMGVLFFLPASLSCLLEGDKSG